MNSVNGCYYISLPEHSSKLTCDHFDSHKQSLLGNIMRRWRKKSIFLHSGIVACLSVGTQCWSSLHCENRNVNVGVGANQRRFVFLSAIFRAVWNRFTIKILGKR